MAAAEGRRGETQLGDLPEDILAQAIALTSPRDASRCAAVSPAFRAAADSDHVWRRFIPTSDDLLLSALPPAAKKKKDAYLGLCDAAVPGDDGGCRVWLDRATGAKCYALSARRLSLPWDDGEFSWSFKPHPLSRFPEVAELVECTCLDIYGSLPASSLTPATPYAAYLVYDTTTNNRGFSFPDQETSLSLTGAGTAARHAVCLRPHDDGDEQQVVVRRRPRRRKDGWWEMEMGRVTMAASKDEVEVVASFEALGWYPKRGLVLHGIEFRPLH